MRASPVRATLALVALITSAGCTFGGGHTDAPLASISFEDIPIGDAPEMPPGGPVGEGRLGPTGGTILDPTSARLVQAVAYRFSLGHCGLLSPVDVDGSFWDPIDGVTPNGQPLDLENDGEMINQTAGVFAVIGDEARFRTEMGSLVHFVRHEGEKEFPGCE